jgi:hypothetical protein
MVCEFESCKICYDSHGGDYEDSANELLRLRVKKGRTEASLTSQKTTTFTDLVFLSIFFISCTSCSY